MDRFGGFFTRRHEVPVDQSSRSNNTGWSADEVSSPNYTKEKCMPTSVTPKTVGSNDGLKRMSSCEPFSEDYFDKRRRLDMSSIGIPSYYIGESLPRQSSLKQPEDYERRSSRDHMRDNRCDLSYNYKGCSESDIGSKIDYTKSADRYTDNSLVSKQSDELRRLNCSQEKDSVQEYSQKFQKVSVYLNKSDESDKFNRGNYQDSRVNRDQYFSQDRCQERYERPHSDFILNKTDGRDLNSRERYPDSRINVNSSSDLNPEIYGKSRCEFIPNKSSDIDVYNGGYSVSSVNGNPSQYFNAENYEKLKSDDFSSNECRRGYYPDSRINRNPSQGLDFEKYARSQSDFNRNDNDKYLRSSCTDSRINSNPCSSYEFSPCTGTGGDILEQRRFSSDVNPELGSGRYYVKDQFNADKQVDGSIKSTNYFESVYNQDCFRGNHSVNRPEVNLKADMGSDLQSNRDSNFKVSELLDSIKKRDEKQKIMPVHGSPRENYNAQNNYDGTYNVVGIRRNTREVPAFARQETSIGSEDDSGLRNDYYSRSRIHADDHNQSRSHVDNYNQLKTHTDSDSFRNVERDDYDHLKNLNIKINNLGRNEEPTSYSKADNYRSSGQLVLNDEDYHNILNIINTIQCKTREHGDKVEADRYKMCNSLPQHSDASSRRENYVENHQNLNKQWNKNTQLQSIQLCNIVTSENATSKTVTLGNNYHDETTKLLSTRIHSQNNKNYKNNEGVPGQTDKNSTFDQNLPKSDNTVKSDRPARGKIRYIYTPNGTIVVPADSDHSVNQTREQRNKNTDQLHNECHAKLLSSNIHSQNYKNNQGVMEQADKNILGMFDQCLQRSNEFGKTSFPISSNHTYRTKNLKTIPNLNKSQLCNEYSITKDRIEMHSANFQPTNSDVISDSNKSDKKVLSASEQVNAQPDAASSINTEEDKNAATTKLDSGVNMKQNQPSIQSIVGKNEKPPPDPGDITDENYDYGEEEEYEGEGEEEDEDWEESGKLECKNVFEQLPEEEFKKYSSVIERYALTGPCGKLLVIAAIGESAEQTLLRTKVMMKRGYLYELYYNERSGKWVCQFTIGDFVIANVTNSKKGQTKIEGESLALKTLQEHYYTLLMRNPFFNPLNTIVHTSGEFGPPITRRSVPRKKIYAVPAKVGEAKKRIHEFLQSDVVHDLVFSFRFPPRTRRTLCNYAKFLGLRVRTLGSKKHKFFVVSKFQDVLKIMEGVANNDIKYVKDFKLVPPGRFDLMKFE